MITSTRNVIIPKRDAVEVNNSRKRERILFELPFFRPSDFRIHI